MKPNPPVSPEKHEQTNGNDSPADPVPSLQDLFDLAEIQDIQDSFARATGVASIITKPDGEPITRPSNFCRLCNEIIRNTDKGRANCFHSDAVIGRHNPDGPIIQPCLSGGLWDAGASISVGGRHIANWMVGQVRQEELEEEKILVYAREIGADENAFIQAYREVTVMPLEQFRAVADALFSIANQMSKIAYQNIQQEKLIGDLREAEKRIRLSDEKFRDLFNSIDDLVYTQDMNGCFLSVNRSMVKSFGYEPNEMIGRLATDFMPSRFRSFFRSEYLDPIVRDGFQDGTSSYYTKDGRKVYLEYRSSYVQPREGEPYISGMGRDVTEKVYAQRKIKRLQEEMLQSRKLEAIGTLSGGIAHDFNNMLGIIIGNVELAMDDIPQWHEARVSLEEIRIASLRAKEVVKQLLNFSRKSDQKKISLTIAPIIAESLKLLRSSIPVTIDIRQDCRNDDTVMADPTQIHQIIINLCTNAAQAMPDTGGVLEIGLVGVEFGPADSEKYHGLAPGKYVALSVKDNGCGMDPETVGRIFDPYFTTKDVGKGTGMGLAVVHGIVKDNNGKIMVESNVGSGSTFLVYLPVIAQKEVSPIEIPAELPAGSEKLLFVDDEETMANMAKKILERMGYRVAAMIDPCEALVRFRRSPDEFDAVITDMSMPHMTGDHLAAEMLKIRPGMPIIICTGHSEHLDAEKARRIGIRGYLEKPVSKQDLATAVRSVLDDRKPA